MAAARHTLANCARCDGGAQVASEGASSKKVTRERFDQHAWPRLRALKAHAETPKNVRKNYVGRTPFWGPIFGPQNGGRESISSYKGPHFGGQIFNPKMGSSRVMFFRAGALSKNGFCEQVRRVHRRFGCAWGGPVGETNFWIGFRTPPILGSSTRASFAGRQQVASGFSQTRIAMMAETGEMVGASFLSICVTLGAASFGPPKTRNLLSSALPFNVVAPLFFWWVWRQLAAHPTSEPTPKPQTTWHSSETDPEPTPNPPYTAWESERNPHGAHREPSRNLHGRARGTHAEPTGSPPQTVSKTAQEATSHPLVFIILFIRGKGDAVGNIETLASIIQRLFL